MHKLGRYLARCYEVLQSITRNRILDFSKEFSKTNMLTCPRVPFWRKRVLDLKTHKLQLESLQSADKTAKLVAWKAKLNDPTVKGLGRWIRFRENSIQAYIYAATPGATNRTQNWGCPTVWWLLETGLGRKWSWQQSSCKCFGSGLFGFRTESSWTWLAGTIAQRLVGLGL